MADPRLSSKEATRVDLESRIHSTLSPVFPEWQAQLRKDANELITTCQSEVCEWNAYRERMSKATDLISGLELKLNSQRAMLSEKQISIASIQTRCDSLACVAGSGASDSQRWSSSQRLRLGSLAGVAFGLVVNIKEQDREHGDCPNQHSRHDNAAEVIEIHLSSSRCSC